MRTILLVGDSIRMGYQANVRCLLDMQAMVLGPTENGGNSRNVLALLERWLDDAQPDLLHINCGLHDLKRERDTGDPAVPVSEYGDNVAEILRRASQRVCTVIWATTTPVNEAWHHANKPFDRRAADVTAYNQVALAAANEARLEINDLHSVIMSVGPDLLLREDGVHYESRGYQLLADKVAGTLLPLL